MRCNELIAYINFSGQISELMSREYLDKIKSMIEKNSNISRHLVIRTQQECDFTVFLDLIELCKLDMCDTKEFVLDYDICSQCNISSTVIEFYLHEVYEVTQKDDYLLSDTNYLSVLLMKIRNRIDKVLGEYAYIDMYVKNKNIIITIEKKYLSSIDEIIRNYCITGLNYECASNSQLEYEDTVNLVQFEIIDKY